MKGLFTILFLSASLVAASQGSSAKLKATGSSLEALIPSGWTVLKSAKGDLNKDGYKDLVFAIQNTNPDNIEKNEGLGSPTIDLNPRVLAIYFWDQENKTYRKQLRSDEFILLRDVPTMDEPLSELEITQEGHLKIVFFIWFSAGSWFTSNHTYTFKFQHNQFELITYESDEFHRASGDSSYHKVDFLSGKIKVEQTKAPEEDTGDETTTTEEISFEPVKLKTILSLGIPFNWAFMDLYI